MIEYTWRGRFDSDEVERLHAEGFAHPPSPDHDWWRQVEQHSLGWVCARESDSLVGWVNVAWDGAGHAFLLDTLVASGNQRRGIGTQIVHVATSQAREAGCEWLHVDFNHHLGAFYRNACGFVPTDAGLVAL